jgi:hypothetical protein
MKTRQRGVVMIVVVISLLAVLAMAGLAIDVSHTLSNKARLQSVVDAAALAGAKVLDQTGSTAQAFAAVTANVQANAENFRALREGGVTPVIEFAAAAAPFEPGGTDPRFVRVRIEALSTTASLVRVLGIDSLQVRASALAGPSPPLEEVCNVLPIVMCTAQTAEPFEYVPGNVYVLKGRGGESGPGNYGLIALGGGGASRVRENLAGGFNQCLEVGESRPTQTGNITGPTAQGLNTRFGVYLGPLNGAKASYPPDVVTDEPSPALRVNGSGQIRQGSTVITRADQLDYNHAAYETQVANENYDYIPRPDGDGAFGRREVVLPIATCSKSQITIRGFGCVFLLQQVQQGDGDIFGEFIEECEAGGRPGGEPGTGGPYIIQLYRDPASADS